MVIAELARYSPYSTGVKISAVSTVFFFFAVAVANFIRLGIASKTDNRFLQRDCTTTWGMYLLIAGEIGGFIVVLWAS